MPTRDEILTTLRTDFPTIAVDRDGESSVLDATAYELTLGAWADALVAAQTADTAETGRRTLRRQVRQALDTLAADRTQLDTDFADVTNAALPLSAAQLRPYLARANRITTHMSLTITGLITTLIDQRLIEPGDTL